MKSSLFTTFTLNFLISTIKYKYYRINYLGLKLEFGLTYSVHIFSRVYPALKWISWINISDNLSM